MSPTDVIRHALSTNLVNEDGESIEIDLLPPLSEAEIDEFARTLPCPLPNDIRELLKFCSGFEGGCTDQVDFTGGLSYGQEEIFPHGLPIAGDGYGNFWIVDLTPASTEFGPIYFACHDAPVILYQSGTLSEFLVELFKTCMPPHNSLIHDVHEDRLYRVWHTNPNVLDHDSCINSSDDALRAFAAELTPQWSIVDLRAAQPGMGFSWGRFGPSTKLRRHGTHAIFAYEHRPTLWQRLVGR